jgi:hypothetical protein
MPLPRRIDAHKHTVHMQYRELLMRHHATSLDIYVQALLS